MSNAVSTSVSGPGGSNLKLTDLPEELQEKVLENLLLAIPEPAGPRPRFSDFWDAFFHESAASDQEFLRTDLFKADENVLRKVRTGSFHLAVLRVCKSLYTIGRPLLMKTNMFTVASPFAMTAVRSCWDPPLKFWTIEPQDQAKIRPVLHLHDSTSTPNTNAANSAPLLMFDCLDLSTFLLFLERRMQSNYPQRPCITITVDETRYFLDRPSIRILTWHCKTTIPGSIRDVVPVRGCPLRNALGTVVSDATLPEAIEWAAGLRESLQASSQRSVAQDVCFDIRPATRFLTGFLSRLEDFVQNGRWPASKVNTDEDPFATYFEIETYNSYHLLKTLDRVLAEVRLSRNGFAPHPLEDKIVKFWYAARHRMDYFLGILAFRGMESMPPTFENLGEFNDRYMVSCSRELLASCCYFSWQIDEARSPPQESHAELCQAALWASSPLVDGLQKTRHALHRSLLGAMPTDNISGDINKPWYDQKRREFKAMKAEWMGKGLSDREYKLGQRRWWLDGQWREDFYRSLEPWWEEMREEKWSDFVEFDLALDIDPPQQPQ